MRTPLSALACFLVSSLRSRLATLTDTAGNMHIRMHFLYVCNNNNQKGDQFEEHRRRTGKREML